MLLSYVSKTSGEFDLLYELNAQHDFRPSYHLLSIVSMSRNNDDAHHIDIHACTHTYQPQKHSNTQTHKHTNPQTHKHTHTDSRQTANQTNTNRHEQTQTDTSRHKQTQADTSRHKQTQTDKLRKEQHTKLLMPSLNTQCLPSAWSFSGYNTWVSLCQTSITQLRIQLPEHAAFQALLCPLARCDAAPPKRVGSL